MDATCFKRRPLAWKEPTWSLHARGWNPEPIYLLLGDVDGDNEVNLFDFGRMVASFGWFAREDPYIDADLDGATEISLWDFAWLVTHFGLVGDD